MRAATDAMTSCGWRTAITAATSNPARRAASNHMPDSSVILGSLMTTSGAAGSVVRNALISAMQAAFSSASNAPSSCRRSDGSNAGAAVAAQDCFVEKDGCARLPIAKRIARVGAHHPGRERTTAQRENPRERRRSGPGHAHHEQSDRAGRSPGLLGGGHEHNSALDAACGAGAPCSTIRSSGGRPARYRRYICSKSVSRLRVTAAALNRELLARVAAWS